MTVPFRLAQAQEVLTRVVTDLADALVTLEHDECATGILVTQAHARSAINRVREARDAYDRHVRGEWD